MGSGEVVIGARGARRALATGVLLVSTGAAIVGLFGRVTFFSVWAEGIGILTIVGAWIHRNNLLVLDDDGLRMTRGRGRRAYTWSELLEVGWRAPISLIRPAASIVVRPKGGRFEIPGPNAPAGLGVLAIFGKQANQDACEKIAAACERHGVPFTKDGDAMEQQPPPGSPLRRDAPKTQPPGGDR